MLRLVLRHYIENTTGASNTAVGSESLDANTTGSDNVAMGRHALDANTTGVQNTALGKVLYFQILQRIIT